MDVNSGAVHAVSDPAFDILSFFENHRSDDFDPLDVLFEKRDNTPTEASAIKSLSQKHDEAALQEAFDELKELAASGLLFSKEDTLMELGAETRGAVIKAMCLHAAHDCNMRCAYCFADEGSFSGTRGLLPLETGKRAIDFLLKHSGARRNLEIDFFGGEPLMNFGVVRDLVAYGNLRASGAGKHIRFTVTTNGLLLDEEKSHFINAHMDNVILSIDGRSEVNDRMRKTLSGAGSYAAVIENIKRFAAEREGLYYLRGTYTKYNKDFAKDVRHLAEMGFNNISMEPVVAPDGAAYALDASDIPELLAEYDRLTDFCLELVEAGKPLSFFHFNVDLEQGPCVFKRVAGCGAGTEYVAVSPEGDIFPCHQFAGESEYKLGNVHDADFGNGLFELFNQAHIYQKSDCRDCWAKYYCSGGCHANALKINGDILKPHQLGCILERKRLECAIGIAAVRSDATF